MTMIPKAREAFRLIEGGQANTSMMPTAASSEDLRLFRWTGVVSEMNGSLKPVIGSQRSTISARDGMGMARTKFRSPR